MKAATIIVGFPLGNWARIVIRFGGYRRVAGYRASVAIGAPFWQGRIAVMK